MWCYVKTKDEDKFLEQYPNLRQYWDTLVLLRVKDASFLPRLFYTNYPSEYLIEYSGKTEPKFKDIDFEFKGKLRPTQKKVVDAILPMYEKNGFINGIIKLPPGTGKTVLTIYLASVLKLKTCIVLDKDSLFKQWIKEIIQFSGSNEDNIGIIKQKLFVTKDKLFTVAMSGTLTSKLKRDINKGFKEINDAQFGLVVYDEVHATSASEIYSKVSLLFRTKNVIGLSATPFHYAEAEILMKNTIGKLIYESNEYEMTPKYNIIHYNSGLKKYTFVMQKMNDYIKQKSYYNKILIKSDIYLNLIKELVEKLNNEGRKIIVICMTIKQVQLISEHLDIIGVEHRRYYGKEKEIDKETDNVIVATYSFSGTGFDMKRLDALILATPLSGKKSLIQVVGRVLRRNEGKKQPVVYDLLDKDFPILTIPEYKRKLNIINSEFPNCKIQESNYSLRK
jgi:DNA repair protein RadD